VKRLRLLFVGDIVGQPGREALRILLPQLKVKYKPHFIVVNGENAAGGRGITAPISKSFFEWGVQIISLGNHAFDHKDIFNWINEENKIVRPANYPPGTPGKGWSICRNNQLTLAVINLQGRTFLPPLDCPFRTVDAILNEKEIRQADYILVDMHAETTSEKQAMGWYLDGKVTAVIGTHTHVQTGDARILPQGTAYLSDVGMTGPYDGILGMDRESVIKKFITQLPVRFDVEKGDWQFNAVLIDADEKTRAKQLTVLRYDRDHPFLS
jgi:hypothetical protein